MSERKHKGNKPEKLDLPEIPENIDIQDKGNLRNKSAPFKVQLQNMKANSENQIFQQLILYRKNFIKQIEESRKSKVIVYYSLSHLEPQDFEMIFDFVSTLGKKHNIDLYIVSQGGYVHPAYKIARLCQDYSKEKFSVLIPYYAKSAATILSLGADEIVMGPASELGPIDPQLFTPNSPPISALALKEALEYITKAIKRDQKLAALYIPLLDKLDLITLGHFEREIESAKQYGKALLVSRKKDKLKEEDAEKIAMKFVQEYKTHGFVIDGSMASSLLKNTVKLLNLDDPIWQSMWRLHNIYDQYMRDRKIIKIIESANESYEIGSNKK